MKTYTLLFLALGMLASCSAPKYAYHFDHYDYNSGKKEKALLPETVTAESSMDTPILLAEQTLLASASVDAVYQPETESNLAVGLSNAKENILALSKAEKKEIRKEAITSIKEYTKAKKSGDMEKAEQLAKAMDNDLKLAAIFGAVGIVAGIIGGEVFWVIAAVAWIIALVFFIKWLVRQ